MAVSGTVPARNPPPFDPQRVARRVRRLTALLGIVGGIWFFTRFGTAWVPANMDTVPSIPPGSWCIVDRFAGGLRVGSDVFVDCEAGRVLSRVAALEADTVTVLHPNASSAWPDSRRFGPLPRAAVHSQVMVAFGGEGTGRGR